MSCPVFIFITLILLIIIKIISEDILSLKLSRKADSFLCELTFLAPHEEGLLGSQESRGGDEGQESARLD